MKAYSLLWKLDIYCGFVRGVQILSAATIAKSATSDELPPVNTIGHLDDDEWYLELRKAVVSPALYDSVGDGDFVLIYDFGEYKYVKIEKGE